ncbi:MAG: divalent-cation tolerance protein CutA [Spirochaetes bacterium]|nr:divalent-cation tolerance protein CutA [Spirochaetota bacterium]
MSDPDKGLYKVVLVTAPRQEADMIGQVIVQQKLSACVNIVDTIKSIYWWENKLNTDEEALLIFKTTKDKAEALITKVKQIHSYDVPEVVVLDISSGNEDYLKWILESVK